MIAETCSPVQSTSMSTDQIWLFLKLSLLLINSEPCCLRFPQVAIALAFTARMGSNRGEEK